MSNYRGEVGGRLYIGTAQGADLDQAGFEALSWTEITGIGGTLGHFSPSEEIISYVLIDGSTAKGKGPKNAGALELELARDFEDAGQIALRAAGATPLAYAFKRELKDSPDGVKTNTVEYTRALVRAVETQAGSAGDFVRQTTSLEAVQDPIVVDPHTPA